MNEVKYSVEEARLGMERLMPSIESYAELVVRKGVNVTDCLLYTSDAADEL